jgi:HEAT repeat protein
VALVALVGVDKQATRGRDVKPATGFAGRVLLDEGERVRTAWGLEHGSVVLIDPRGRERWRKPGSAFKRPRAELVLASVQATVERERDPAALESALARLADGSARERAAAVRRLGELEAPQAREALEARAADAHETAGVRRAALAALARLRDPRSIDVVAGVATHAEAPREVRAAAAALLVGFGDDFDPPAGEDWPPPWSSAESRELAQRRAGLLPAASALLAAETPELRRAGAALLARLRHADALEPLLALAEDRDARVREAALVGLCEWRDDERARSAARARERDSDADVKRVARYLIEGPVGKLRE